MMFLSVYGGRSWISSSGTTQGARHRRFLALMVGAPGSPAPTPPREARHRCFVALMVDDPGSTALTPPRAPALDVS
jgi:hypothetical protein